MKRNKTEAGSLLSGQAKVANT